MRLLCFEGKGIQKCHFWWNKNQQLLPSFISMILFFLFKGLNTKIMSRYECGTIWSAIRNLLRIIWKFLVKLSKNELKRLLKASWRNFQTHLKQTFQQKKKNEKLINAALSRNKKIINAVLLQRNCKGIILWVLAEKMENLICAWEHSRRAVKWNLSENLHVKKSKNEIISRKRG